MASSLITCSTCGDTRWVALKVPVGDPRHGIAQVCPDCGQHDAEAMLRKEKYAELPNSGQPRTFESWEPNSELAESFDAAKSYALGMEASPILVLQGPNGTGKSHLIEAIGRSLLAEGSIVKFTFMPDWLAALKATFNTSDEATYDAVFESYAVTPEILLMDDLGAERTTEWTVGEITRLFDLRYRNDQRTVVTTQYGEMETEARQGSRVADRLFDLGTGKVRVVSNNGESYRTGRRRG